VCQAGASIDLLCAALAAAEAASGGRPSLRPRNNRAAQKWEPPQKRAINRMGRTGAPSQYCEREPVNASGASVDQVDCLVRADIDIGHIRRLTVGVFPAQIQVTTLDLGYFGPRPLAGFQRA
jgi:hypothetical protein